MAPATYLRLIVRRWRAAGSRSLARPVGGRGQSRQGHGLYRGMDLELLDPNDDNELMLLLEAVHERRRPGGVTASDEPVKPRLHVAMHHVVARQILADDPPKTWQTVQRLAGQGFDWHNIMHMIAELVVHDVYAAVAEHRQFDPDDYARRLDQLPTG
jgi:Domain of unknown function (DUF1841)